jgi:glycosyltransferase involved in cell wall biosynthesis
MSGDGRKSPPILFLLSTLIVGGSEVKTVRLANTLVSRGSGVVIAYLNGPDSLRDSIDDRIPVIHLHRTGVFSVAATRALFRTIDRYQPDSIVAVNLYPGLYAALAKLWHRHSSLRICVSINTTEFFDRKNRWQMLLYRHVLAYADQVIFGAEEQAAIWRQRYRVGRSDRSIVLHNGVDIDYFACEARHPLPRSALPQTRYLIGTVGKLRAEKAHLDLIKATNLLRTRGIDVGAVIVGEGPERTHIEQEVTRSGLGRFVYLAGEVSDVRPFLQSMDVFVLTSIAVETFSNATLEAMAMARPVVSARVGGMQEMLQFGGGLIVERRDIGGLAGAVELLLTDQELRMRLSREARRATEEHYSWEAMVQRFESEVLRDLSNSLSPTQPTSGDQLGEV